MMLNADRNVRDDTNDTLEYSGVIPWDKLTVIEQEDDSNRKLQQEIVDEATLTITTLAGVKYQLSPVPMSRMPSEKSQDWLAFQRGHIPGTSLSETEQNRIQAFMRKHKTEALNDGTDIVTLAGGLLAYCDLSKF